ncbi:MAG: hypothetical protein IBX57_11545 [Gammaproteobacteria bacterium]|nr:hypothetical protein [Gammaproteobacteria bacterium]
MTLPKLTNREQLLFGLALTVLILGGYGLFGFMPETKAIADLNKAMKATEIKLLKAEIPDEPEEDLDDLIIQLEDQKQTMALIEQEAQAIESSLAPFNSQQIIVQISQLAKAQNLRVKETEAYKTIAQNQTQPARTNTKTKRKQATQAPPPSDVILPETMSWIARMSEGTMFYRPMQRYVLEGDYQKIVQFVYELDNLPWEVTIVRLKISKSATTVPFGMAQQLDAELVLTL